MVSEGMQKWSSQNPIVWKWVVYYEEVYNECFILVPSPIVTDKVTHPLGLIEDLKNPTIRLVIGLSG